MEHKDGRPYHTFRTYTVLVDGNDITFKNCTFENTAGPGEVKSGQAIALYLDGDDIHLENCILKGHQDTLFLAPLPEKEREMDGFLGPKQFTPRTMRSFLF
jgi:pectinesterase